MIQYSNSFIFNYIYRLKILIFKALHYSKDFKDHKEEAKNFVDTQTYDLYITYDKFYQTPRMWISGYSTVPKSNSFLLLMIIF